MQSGNYGSVLTHLARETLTANGNATQGDAGTFSSSFRVFSGYTMGGGAVYNTVTVSDYHNNGESTTFNGTITAGETKIVSEAGTYSLSAQQHGSYSGASFAFDTMVYNVTATRKTSQEDYSGFTVNSNITSTISSRKVHAGVTNLDSYDTGVSSSFTRQDTVTSFTTATNVDLSTYALYQAGMYGGQSWNLSSFNLLMQDQSASTYVNIFEILSQQSGGISDDSTWAGVQIYNIGGTFIFGGSASTIVEIYSTSGYTISEQGTFANGTVGLSNFAYIQAQARQQSTTASAGGLQTFAGTDDTGMGSANPTFTGTGVNTVTYQNDQSSSSTLSQYGAFSGGAFSLGTVTYAGSSSNSFTAADDSASSWTGGYSGNETIAKADSASDSQYVNATGSFAGGSWSLSSYVLQGSSQQADSSSTTRYQSVGTTGFSGSTYAISDASTGSSTLYQSGTQSAGTYANASYAYVDGSVATLAAIAQSMGMTSGETRTEIAGSTIILGGTQQVGSAATYSYDNGWGATTDTNNGTATSDQPTPDPVVQFGTPDASMVAAAGVGQLAGVAQTQSSAMPVAAAQPAAGYLTPGATAPVPMSVNMRAVAATADWSNATVYASQRAVSNWSRQMTLHGFQPASGPAVEALMGRAAGASFGFLAWKALEPAMKVALWGQATAASGPIMEFLLLDDESGELAKYIFGQMGFTSNSSDPYVREIDKMLYNDGQPLTAGSAPLYGTYWDGKARSAQDALAKVGPFWSAGVNIVAAMWIIGPTALIGVAGPAIGALTNAGQGLIPNIIGGADAETIASDFGSQFLEGAVIGGLGVLGGGAQSARAPARGPILEATMLEHGGGFRPGGRPRVRITGPIEQPAGRGGVNRGGTPPFNPSSRGGFGGVGQRMRAGGGGPDGVAPEGIGTRNPRNATRPEREAIIDELGMGSTRSNIPPGNVQPEESYVYALFKNGKIFRFGESNDPARRLLQHISESGPLTMKVLPGGPHPKPIAFEIQVGYIKRFFDYWGRLPPGNRNFS